MPLSESRIEILYVRKKRLAYAMQLLSEGCTVTEASEQSGFPDYSDVIALVQKAYGITPLKYKQQKQKERQLQV